MTNPKPKPTLAEYLLLVGVIAVGILGAVVTLADASVRW